MTGPEIGMAEAGDDHRPLLVFDVNQTLLNIDALQPLFQRIFGQPARMRECFAQLIL